jgi:uncharacterized membrane protein YbhN (UPF0104 family)
VGRFRRPSRERAARSATAQDLPPGFEARSIRRRLLTVVGVLVFVALIAAFAPGLHELRQRLGSAQPGWLVLAVVLEGLSCLSYVLMFRPVFCPGMSRRTASELALSELAIGSLVPASGAAGLAFGAWALRRGGMPGDQIARRSVAFFVLKSSVNFVAVTVVGVAMWLGAGPQRSALLTLLPAVLAAAAIAAVAVVGRRLHSTGGRRWYERGLDALADGTREAGGILRRGDWRVIAGSVGYWAFDNAVLWATLRAFGETPAVTLVLMGYLIGQLGGLLPLPGGLGGIDGGLVGTLIVYGLPAAAVVAAVLAYRVILFWLPLFLGGPAFLSLRKGLNDPTRPDICDPPLVEAHNGDPGRGAGSR